MTTWTYKTKFSGQTPITYNEAGKTYNQASYLYNGIIGTVWNYLTKH
jgi:hypothetical protein